MKTSENNLPWAISIENYKGTDYKSIKDCKGESAMKVSNAELILTACNNHHQLLEALENLLIRANALDQSCTAEGLNNCQCIANARNAIKKAKGE